MAKAAGKDDLFGRGRILALSPDDASIPAAEKVLKKGGFGTVEATADGKGWWVVCRGLTGTYQVSVRAEHGTVVCTCTCPSPKYPCKHALALLLYLSEHPEERAEPEAPRYAPGDFEGLIRAVFADPDDDTPRLVFADFLDENDQPDRAALIRLQCELDRAPARSDRARELRADEKRQLAKLRPTVGTLPEGIRATFRRGFLHLSLDVYELPDVGSLPERFTRLFRDGWVEVVRLGAYLFDPPGEELAPLFGLAAELDFSAWVLNESHLLAVVAETAAMRATGRLRRVKVAKQNRKAFDGLTAARAGGAGPAVDEREYRWLTPQSLDLLIRSGRLRTARRLTLEGRLGDRETEMLAAADLSGVEELYLDGWAPGPAALAALADSPGLPDLATVGLENMVLGPPHAAALAGFGPRLRRLVLAGRGVSAAAVARLADGRFPALRALDLRAVGLTPAAAAAVLRSPHLPSLAEVRLTTDVLPGEELLPLLLGAADRPELTLTSPGVELSRWSEPTGVRVGIDAEGQAVGDLFGRLTRTAATRRVTGVTVSGGGVTAAGLRAAAKAFDPAALRELLLFDLPLKNEGAAALAAAFAGYPLESLRLSFCRVQAAGVAALANSSLLDSVRELDLTGNSVGQSGVAALLRSEHLGRLGRLELSNDRLTVEGKKALKAKFGKKLVT
ncbi:MAG: hypothetical protein C0501_30140 [Isosphaera sp.]|nr:hypothetical protein [Isosphaera sp.]